MSDEEYLSEVGESEEDDDAGADEDKATSPREGDEDGDDVEPEEGEELDEEEAEEQEEVDQFDPNPLTEDHIRQALSMLSQIGDGLSHAYIQLSITESELTDINKASSLIHLRHINLTNNYIKDLSPLSSLTHLLTLKADQNLLTKVAIEELPYLQVASLRKNKIASMASMTHPLLTKLYLTDNMISTINFPDPDRLASLSILDLRGNKMEALTGSFPPNLQELYLAANLIKTVGPLEGLQKLRILHLRDNQLESLDGFADARLSNLSYLNLRGNSLEESTELTKIKSLPKLKALVLQENPLSEADEYRIEVLVSMGTKTKLLRLDKDEVDEEELDEAKAVSEEQEQKRQEEEAAAAEAAAAAAQGDAGDSNGGIALSMNLQTQNTTDSCQS